MFLCQAYKIDILVFVYFLPLKKSFKNELHMSNWSKIVVLFVILGILLKMLSI